MPLMPESYRLGDLPECPEPTAQPQKPSRVRDWLQQHKIRPHPSKRSVGLLPDGTQIPLSPSQARELLLMNMTAETPTPTPLPTPLESPALEQPTLPAQLCTRLDRIELLLFRILTALEHR